MGHYYFDEFFASGKEESISPFLTTHSRSWGKNLPLKISIVSALLLILSFIFFFFIPVISEISLMLVYFLSGTPALIAACDDIKKFHINIDLLMTLAALLSVLIGSPMEGALLLVLFEISGALEEFVTKKTHTGLIHLNQIAPKMGCVIEDDGTFFEQSVKEIALGQALLVRAGEVVPLDGEVIAGSSFVNLSHLTGETRAVPRTVGDEVPAGAYNLDGTLTIRVTRRSADSTLSRIIKLITEAQEAKPKLEKILDRFGSYYASAIILLFLFFTASFPYLLNIPFLGVEGALYRALSFLVAASPCALILATPTAYLSAISSCSRKGILLKGGVVLDALKRCSQIAFDKTGTLTTGELVCHGFYPLAEESIDDSMAIGIAAGLERHAVHPIARAVLRYARDKKIDPIEIADFQHVAGQGLEGFVIVKGKKIEVAIGNYGWIFSKNSFSLPKTENHICSYLLIETTIYQITFTDMVRKSAEKALQPLKKRGLKLFMLTGDNEKSGKSVASLLDLTLFHSLKPEEKLEHVARLSKEGGLIMVGDGVNDGPALARATVGIAMGKVGSATAIEAADVVLLQDDLELIDFLLNKADKTIRILKQNLTLALLVIVGTTMPALFGFVPLWAAVVLHEGGTLLVGLNSLRLLKNRESS